MDYCYVKLADASRGYGLEFEDILSPNRINYIEVIVVIIVLIFYTDPERTRISKRAIIYSVNI